MKLVDILARELKVWPEEVSVLSQLRHNGAIINGKGYDGREWARLQIADDTPPAGVLVTKAQWQDAVSTLKDKNCAHLWVGWTDIEACELCNKTRKIHLEWDGNGSPPIGCLVEDRSVPCGAVYIYEVVDVEDTLVAIKRPGSLKVVDLYGITPVKPIKTPEQIAAEAYQRNLGELANQIGGYFGFDDPRPSDVGVAEYLLDHGYRKFEIVEGE